MQGHHSGKPVVLVMAGHDPSGGAGIQADIESIAANGCHATTVITCLTEQNTTEFKRAIPCNPVDFRQQIDVLLTDMPVHACKIGLVSSEEILYEIEKIIFSLNDIPVVLDPVISAGTGDTIMTETNCTSIRDRLLTRIKVITPNSMEARLLSGEDDLDRAGSELIRRGCHAVLITGTHENTEQVINTLYLKNESPLRYRWERLPGVYHGSGCTLSSALAARLAVGDSIHQAVATAQDFTWRSLKSGMHLGKGQLHPDRYYPK